MLKFKIKYLNKNDKYLYQKLEKNIYINNEIYKINNELKTEIDNIPFDKWKIIRSISSNYEMIGNNRIHSDNKIKSINIISRAYFKLWEILNIYENRTNFNKKEKLNIACLAEAPGGFIQCIINYRKEKIKNDKITAISIKNKDKDNNNIKWNIVDENNLKIIYGDSKKNHDGNLYNPEIIDYFINAHKYKLDFITADGGLLLHNIQENYKSHFHINLFLSELYIATKLLKYNGFFIIKIYEISSKLMLDFILLLNYIFYNIKIIKPKTSREMNNEKYVFCYFLRPNIDYIVNNIYKILVKLWNNKTLLLINILDDIIYENNSKIIDILKQIELKNLNIQNDKLKIAIQLTKLSKEELKKELKNKQKEHYKNAYRWFKLNNIYLN